MSALLINPHYCPEDKDIVDFVNSSNISLEELIQCLRKKGVYVSKDARKEDVADLFAREIYTWEDVSELLSLLEISPHKENVILGNHDSAADFELIEDAVQSVKEFRLKKYGDNVNIEKIGADEYRISIEYTKVDYEKTRLIQSVEREAEIIVQKTPTGFRTQRTDSDCAGSVELAILGEFERLATGEDCELKTERLRLGKIVGLKKRVQFFVDLMEGINGYNFEQIASARAQSYKESGQVSLGDEVEVTESYKTAVESLIINGKNVGGSDIYDSVIGKDFFISSATWTAVSDTDECRKIEVKAAFVPVQKDQELQISVNYVWLFRSEELQPKAKPNPIQRGRFGDLLRDSAEASYRKAIS